MQHCNAKIDDFVPRGVHRTKHIQVYMSAHEGY